MRTTQDKFTDALAAIAAGHDLELVNDRGWANTGVFRIEGKDSFVPIISMRYSFQDGYASFDDLLPATLGDRDKMLRDLPGGPITPHGRYFPHVTNEELETRVLMAVRQHLKSREEARVA